jgi:hypothetical protein
MCLEGIEHTLTVWDSKGTAFDCFFAINRVSIRAIVSWVFLTPSRGQRQHLDDSSTTHFTYLLDTSLVHIDPIPRYSL